MGRVNVHYLQSQFRGRVIERNEAVVTINSSDTVFLRTAPTLITSDKTACALKMSVNGSTEELQTYECKDAAKSKAAAVEKMYEILDAIDEAGKSNRTIDVYLDDSIEKAHNKAKRQENIDRD